jgi:acetyl-CoA carboxylase carboxyl transferase subunit alpha
MLLKKQLLKTLEEIKSIDPQKRVEMRIEKYSKMGHFDELPTGAYIPQGQ